MLKIFTRIALAAILVSGFGLLHAQKGNPGLDYLLKNPEDFRVAKEDIFDVRVRDDYRSPDGTRHVYIGQRLNGLDIHNAQAAIHLKDNRRIHHTSGLVNDLTTLALNLPTAPAFSAQNAVASAADAISPGFAVAQAAGKDGDQLLFDLPGVSQDPVRAQLVYLPGENGLSLEWRVVIDAHRRGGDYWMIFVNASTGDVTAREKLTVNCSFGDRPHTHTPSNSPFLAPTAAAPAAPSLRTKSLMVESSSYTVIPFGEESPNQSPFVVERDPFDSLASPFGWHDVNGQPGAEFTITRGNNVHVYPDREEGDANNNTPDAETADGGAELNFNFEYDVSATLDEKLPAGLTQLFYTNNKVHDWLWHHGFDEASGNFQRNNYGNGGRGNDDVRAEAQDGSGQNNANFATPADGSQPRMQMQIFSGLSSSMNIAGTSEISGEYSTGTADFGLDIAINGPISGTLAIATDNSANPTLACEAVTSDVAGKVALIQRGDCFFEQKAANAEAAGAIGVIICSQEDALLNMTGPGTFGVTIPVVLITRSDCAPITVAVDNGDTVEVNFEFNQLPRNPSEFDVGVVAHEYGHGVSNRLIGGPSNAFCMRNDEQMGEGWSDFFTLASTPKTNVNNPDGTEGRSIGTWAQGLNPQNSGFRSQPYSTDMMINTKTYNDVIFTGFDGAPHPVGEVWNAVLWDIYWAFVDEYGFDDDLIQGDGGNNMAVELVVEGLKFTKCSPGLVDGREGILAADEALYGGQHFCMLYELFARRGIGFGAEQGSSDDRTDNQQSFEVSPYCPGEIRLAKEYGSEDIDAGEDIDVTLTAYSYRAGSTQNIEITDEIPAGMILDENSIDGVSDFVIDGNVITFRIDEMELDEEIFIDYRMTSDPTVGSTSGFFDGGEISDDSWDYINITGNQFWSLSDTTPYEGAAAYYVPAVGSEQDQVLQSFEPIEMIGTNPHLRFFTQYSTEAGWDGGVVEYSLDGNEWTRVLGSDIVRGSYRGQAAPEAIDSTLGESFWGRNGRYDEIMIDMSAFAGDEVFVRWRFLSDDNTPGVGWWVDNIEVVDVVNFDTEATLTSDEGDDVTVRGGNLGVVVYNPQTTSTEDPVLGQTTVSVFPNPASDLANVRIQTERPGTAAVRLLTVDGRMIVNQQVELRPGANQTTLPTGDLPTGVYVVQVMGAEQISTVKLTVQ